ncbi:MAG: hypothetical protein RI947_1266 [Candidatus Parcubacteria bacterium]|jgi:hypothetical protein
MLNFIMSVWKSILSQISKGLNSVAASDNSEAIQEPPVTYFTIMVDAGSTENQHFTTVGIPLEEAKELLASGRLVNLESYEWLVALLTLRVRATIMMRETVHMAAFRPGDRFLIANFTRKGNHEAEPTYQNMADAELTFTIGTFH